MPGALTRLVRDRQETALVLSLTALIGLAWIYIVWMSLDVTAIGVEALGPRSHAQHPETSDLGQFAMLFVMWVVMMAAMMLPVAFPVLGIHARFRRGRDPRVSATVPTVLFALGYVAAWTAFSGVAAAAQTVLEAHALTDPLAGKLQSTVVAGAIMVLVGLFQLTPLKNACLTRCRTPLGFLMTSWRDGRFGAVVMGAHYGVYCVACCWALMALLFVAGVMNLLWMALITVFMALEKLASRGSAIARVGGVVLVAGGFALMSTGWLR